MHLCYGVTNVLGTHNSNDALCVRAILWVICLNKTGKVKSIHIHIAGDLSQCSTRLHSALHQTYLWQCRGLGMWRRARSKGPHCWDLIPLLKLLQSMCIRVWLLWPCWMLGDVLKVFRWVWMKGCLSLVIQHQDALESRAPVLVQMCWKVNGRSGCCLSFTWIEVTTATTSINERKKTLSWNPLRDQWRFWFSIWYFQGVCAYFCRAGWGIQHPSGQPGPRFYHPHDKKFLPHIQPESPSFSVKPSSDVLILRPISPCSGAGCTLGIWTRSRFLRKKSSKIMHLVELCHPALGGRVASGRFLG